MMLIPNESKTKRLAAAEMFTPRESKKKSMVSAIMPIPKESNNEAVRNGDETHTEKAKE